MADKKLVIQVDAKVSPAVQNLNKLLDDFATRGNKVARAFQTVSGVGPEGQQTVKQGGLAKSLLQEKKLFDDLGKSGEKLAKVLNDQVGRSQVILAKQLDTSTKNLDQLVKRHEQAQARISKLKMEGADPARIALAEKYAGRSGEDVLTGAAQQSQVRAALEAFKSPSGMTALRSVATSVAGSVITAVGTGLAVGTVMQAGVRSAQAFYNAPYAARAAMGQALAPGLAGGLQGDIASAVAMQEATSDPDRSSRMWWTQQGAGVSNVMTMLKAFVPFSGTPFSELVGTARSFQERQAQALVQQDVERQQQLMAADPATVARVQYLQSNAGSNVAMMRESGLDYRVLQAYREVGAREGQLAPEQYDAIFRSLAGAVGTRGATLSMGPGSPLFAAIRGGLSQQTAVSLAAAGQMSGANLLGLGTDYDRTIQNLVGNQVAGAILDPSRLLSAGGGAGYMGQLLAGVGGGRTSAEQVRIAQQNAIGDQAFSNLAGADPFQQSLNIANAIGILGKRGQHGVLAQSKLSEVFKDPALLANVMAGGEMPGQWTGVGLKREDIRAFTKDTLHQAALTARRYGGNLPGTRALDKLARGENLTEAEAQMAGGMLAEARPGVFTDVSGTAFARRASGLRAGRGAEAGAGTGRGDAAAGSMELRALDVTVRNIVTNLGKLGGATQEVAIQVNKAAAAIAAATSWMETALPTAMSYSQPFLLRAQANPGAYDSPKAK